jgi:hypothetical protein
MKALRIILTGTALACLTQLNGVAFACAACAGGKTDSPMAQGMNAGIFALLGVIGTVLCGAATFFVFLARRSAMVAKPEKDIKS